MNSIHTKNYIYFKGDKKTPAGTSFQPENENLNSGNEHQAPKEYILRLNPLQKFKLKAKKIGVEIPSSIFRGLQGDKNVSFNDFLQMAMVPYYLGGAMLYNCFRSGGDVVTAKKQGVGVVMYYLGMDLGNKFIDDFIKNKFGIDLNLSYKARDGKVHKVFESADFTRWDLLTQDDWNKMGDKLGIPEDIADRDAAIKTEVSKILLRARVWKLLIGGTFAAIGAGFLARSKQWANLFTNIPAIKTSFKGLFTGSTGKTLTERIKNLTTVSSTAINNEIVRPITEGFKSLPSKYLGSLPVGKIAIAALIGLPVLALINLITTPNKHRSYVSKSHAMPSELKVQNSPALIKELFGKINPNKIDYEELYSRYYKNPASQISSIPGYISNIPDQITKNTLSQLNPSHIRNNLSPFNTFETFIKNGGRRNG